ncbi:GMC oxidoreductase [Aspergillus sclerotioniger CBS 115572]|uniref:GMC oxidoreductase n=1 Tax=Aspergillus sclerotioniger CBS 115572 TaxID=1450535 RepID=A0A317VBG4_9EURO|nr:GMC oxidoreductase [Aspergillus sclerotioniger CBS 115572]PWY70338.1 GMC oxidoreductase [Aspergillus sclerotioniger CBS 115572]
MRAFWPLLSLAAVATAHDGPDLNLFDYGQRGPLLGTWLGIPGQNATFDYIVIGGGTAGLTVASRLVKSGYLSVAVVEAGGFYEIDNGDLSVIPEYMNFFIGPDPSDYQPLIDWGFLTQPQQSLGDRVLHLPRGKTLGGGSARHHMYYQRPTIGSLHKWAEEVDDESYEFDNMLPYYKKSVHFTPPDEELFTNSTNIQNPEAFSSSGGPLEVSSGNFVDGFGTWLRKALIALGLKQTEFNSGNLSGSGYSTLTINPSNAHRSSSETSFLQSTLNSGIGPVVYHKTLAQRINFDTHRVTTGVQVQTAGTFGTPSVNFTLSARKEVILSAGAIQSPQLLMVSGIGPHDQLSRFNITCISHTPGVGQNLQDHPMAGTTHRVDVPTVATLADDEALVESNVKQYIENATGPLSLPGPGYFGWEKLPKPYRWRLSNETIAALSTLPDDWPETMYTASGFAQTANADDKQIYATIVFADAAPFSRGQITLAGPNMTTPPIIDPQWLSNSTDMEVMVNAVKRSRQIWAELAELGVADPEEYLPGNNVTTNEQIRDFLRKNTITFSHASSTCKMGRKDDPMAVLDSSARVYGVRGLRVVDASSFPFLPPGLPQSTVYAFAEKIADDILHGR